MPTLRVAPLCLLALFAAGTLTAQSNDKIPVKVTSPNGQITLLLFDAGAAMSGGDRAACGSAACGRSRWT